MHIHLELHYQNGQRTAQHFALPLHIGKASTNQLVLSGWRVAKQHAYLYEEAGALYLEDLGSLYGSHVNGVRIGKYGPLKVQDQIIIGPVLMHIQQITSCSLNTNGSGPSESEALAEPQPESQAAVLTQFAEFTPIDTQLQQRLHTLLIEALDLRRRSLSHMSDAELRAHALQQLHELAEKLQLSTEAHTPELLRTVVDEAIGLGPLERLLEQADITEIMVNGPQRIYIERHGRCELSPYVFSSTEALLAVIDRIVSPLGRRIDDSSPMVDARLADGSRVNAVIAPIAIHGPCLTIRKFSQQRLALGDLLGMQALNKPMAEFLSLCVHHKKNVLVSGGTGSGKTTLLNILSNAIPATERVITIEDAAELQLAQGNVVSLEARPTNTEGKGHVSIRDLVRNALRMRPDRIVIGECRGAEAFDMLAAMNTGHEGSLTTLHANSPRDALARLETLILMAGMELPLSAVREHIAAAIHIIVQQVRLANGQRIISSISELTGLEAGRIQIQTLFQHCATAQQFKATGVYPVCFEQQAVALDPQWFVVKGA